MRPGSLRSQGGHSWHRTGLIGDIWKRSLLCCSGHNQADDNNDVWKIYPFVSSNSWQVAKWSGGNEVKEKERVVVDDWWERHCNCLSESRDGENEDRVQGVAQWLVGLIRGAERGNAWVKGLCLRLFQQVVDTSKLSLPCRGCRAHVDFYCTRGIYIVW